MESKRVQNLLRVLITLVGAGIGAGLMALFFKINSLQGGSQASVKTLLLAYIPSCLICGLILLLLSNRIIRAGAKLYNEILDRFRNMDARQLLVCLAGLIIGLLIAALLSRITAMITSSIFSISVTAILYLVCGVIGWNIGRIRGADVFEVMTSTARPKVRRFHKKSPGKLARDARKTGLKVKLLDTSVIIDGRIAELYRMGIPEGNLVVPQFVLNELRAIADSADPAKRSRGKRGLDILQKMQMQQRDAVRITGTDWTDTDDVDVKIIRLAQQIDACIVTCDNNLKKIAAVASIPVININEIANLLKPVIMAGENLTVMISREGKERSQGVGYMSDGTMIVIEDGQKHLNESVAVTVTSVLQTSAGRMIFARLNETESN